MQSFWRFARLMLRRRLMLTLALTCAVLSAAGLGVGLLAVWGIIEMVLSGGEGGSSLALLAREFNAGDPIVRVPDGLVEVLPTTAFASVVWILVASTGLMVFGATTTFLHQYIAATLSTVTVAQVRLDAFRHAVHMPLARVFRRGPAEIISRINKDSTELQRGFIALTSKAVAQATKGFAAFLMAVIIDWRITAIAVLVGPVIGVVLRKFGRSIRRAIRGSLRAQEDLLRVSNESLQGLRAVKSSVGERYAVRRFAQVNREVLSQELRARTARALSSPIVETLAMIAAMVFVAFAAREIIAGRLEVATVTTVMLGLGIAAASAKPLSGLVNDIQAAAAPAERLAEILDEPAERAGRGGERRPPMARHARSIEFDDVVVRYEGAEENAVDGATLTIAHGEVVAFVGPNGCGKTTLLSVLPRLLEANGGVVRIDGVDVREVDLRSLRRQIGVVTQDSVLMRGTIEENIRFGLLGVTRADVEVAAQRAHADEFIRALPEGYDAPVQEQGSSLSGGQRQRIAIARALVRDPSILILDEATSQIDTESETRINEAIRAFAHDRTVLLIAHRPATIRSADRIIVMEAGRVIDHGDHAALVERCPLYRSIVGAEGEAISA